MSASDETVPLASHVAAQLVVLGMPGLLSFMKLQRSMPAQQMSAPGHHMQKVAAGQNKLMGSAHTNRSSPVNTYI